MKMFSTIIHTQPRILLVGVRGDPNGIWYPCAMGWGLVLLEKSSVAVAAASQAVKQGSWHLGEACEGCPPDVIRHTFAERKKDDAHTVVARVWRYTNRDNNRRILGCV